MAAHQVPPSWDSPGKNTGVGCHFPLQQTSLVAQAVQSLSTMQETWVRALGWEDPLEKEMTIHSSVLSESEVSQSCPTLRDPMD